MRISTIIAAAAALVATAATAQGVDADLLRMAKSVGSAKLTSTPQNADFARRTRVAEAQDPWKPVQGAATSARVDYDGDGRADTARMVANSRQGGVMVTLAATGRPLLAFRQDGRFDPGVQMVAAGTRRLLVSFPDTGVAILNYENGRPTARVIGD